MTDQKLLWFINGQGLERTIYISIYRNHICQLFCIFLWWACHPFILFCICTEIQKGEDRLLEILTSLENDNYNENWIRSLEDTTTMSRASKLKATTTMSRASIPNACSLVSVVWTPYSMIALQMLCPFQTNSIHICWCTSIWSPGWSSKLKYPDLK